jgi:hypothetical protein
VSIEINRFQIACANPMRDGADMGIKRDAAIEMRLAGYIANLADEFDAHDQRVVGAVVPFGVRRFDGIDEADGAGCAQIDRDHPPDGPEAVARRLHPVCDGRYCRPCAIALDDAAEHARFGLKRVAPFLADGIAFMSRSLNIHRAFPPITDTG